MCLVAATTAAALVSDAEDVQQPSPPADVRGGSSAAVAVMFKLPALFILGRSCMHWAKEFDDNAADPSRVDAQVVVLQQLVLPPVQQWLQASRTQEQLFAAGYAPKGLPQQLHQATEALQVVDVSGGCDENSRSIDTACLQRAAQQLQAAGSALCSFAVPCLCNNPPCTNVSGYTELGLVSGRSCICGGCRVARYCGRACQRLRGSSTSRCVQHWQQQQQQQQQLPQQLQV
jgi:hypothetical protein